MLPGGVSHRPSDVWSIMSHTIRSSLCRLCKIPLVCKSWAHIASLQAWQEVHVENSVYDLLDFLKVSPGAKSCSQAYHLSARRYLQDGLMVSA